MPNANETQNTKAASDPKTPKTPTEMTGGNLDTDRLGQEAVSTGATMHNCRLGGQEGLGTLQVVRGQNLNVLEIRGTWRSNNDDASDEGELARLCEAAATGSAVRYQGPVDDPGGKKERADVDVEVTWTKRYRFDAVEGQEEREGPERRIFNFQPVDGERGLFR